MTLQITGTLSHKQHAFIHDPSREVLIAGGIRSGKSYPLCIKAAMLAWIAGARVGLCRKTLTSFKDTTLKVLLEGDANTAPVLPPDSYEHDKSGKEIRLKGGGSIVYFSLEEPERVRGLTLSACGVDELSDLSPEDWSLLSGRVSVKLPGKPRQLFGATNPRSASHWLAKRFGIVGKHVDSTLAVDGCSAYLVNTFENERNLDPTFLRDLRLTHTGIAWDRDVLGWWVSQEGLVYSNFDRRVHVRRYEGDYCRQIVAVDDGFNDKFVALLGGVTPEGVLHFSKEVYVSGLSTDAKKAKLRAIIGDAEIERIVVDDSAATLIEDLRQDGFPATKAQKGSLFGGIAKVRNRFELGEGPPRMTISPACTNLRDELEKYEYKAGTETPKEGNDHALDALRYGVLHFDRGAVSPVINRRRQGRTEESASIRSKEESQAIKEFDRLWNDRTFR